ncbi:hypothetical protein GGF43_000600 [Coemansia sp. RSA 2618]|nr:hypothetical protein GGF43_000600 [Coemansia sp. RSA 2618]
MLQYFIKGKQLPSWDLEIQVFCDIARYHGLLRFPESSDDNIDSIDFAKLHEQFSAQPIPPSKLAENVGVYCALDITVSDHPINPNSLAGIGEVTEQPLRDLIQKDAAGTTSRLIPCELLASWPVCAAHNIARNSYEQVLKMRPLDESEKIVLWLHGGAYVMGSPASHREVLGKFSEHSARRCLVVDYRLAPKSAFPAQLHDALIAYYYLLTRGFKPANIVVAGDSAGGHLAMDLILLLKHISSTDSHTNCLLPAGIILVSPMPGLDLRGASLHTNAPYDYILPTPLEWPTSPIRLLYKPGQKCTDEYRKELCNPILTPVYGDLSGFPPTIIQCGGGEILVDDVRQLFDKIKRDNPRECRIVWEEYPEMVHVFHRFLSRPESKAAFESVARFLDAL